MGCQWCLITAPILNFEIDTLFSLVHLLGLRVWCLSLGFVQLTDHDVVTYNHVNEFKFSLGHKWVACQIQNKQHTKFKGEIAISCLPHLSHQGLPEGHSDLLKISIFQLTQNLNQNLRFSPVQECWWISRLWGSPHSGSTAPSRTEELAWRRTLSRKMLSYLGNKRL